MNDLVLGKQRVHRQKAHDLVPLPDTDNHRRYQQQHRHDCDPGLATWAASRLRWQSDRPLAEPSPLTRWPDRPTRIVIALGDRVARPDWLEEEATRWTGGEAPITMPGGHSPMLAQPERLAEILASTLPD